MEEFVDALALIFGTVSNLVFHHEFSVNQAFSIFFEPVFIEEAAEESLYFGNRHVLSHHALGCVKDIVI